MYPCSGIAQLVEQLICNQKVAGSNPAAGTKRISYHPSLRLNNMSKVALYGMSFRHPKAFEILNSFARAHVDREAAFEAALGWHAITSALTEFQRSLDHPATKSETAEFAESKKYKDALKAACSSHALAAAVLHDSKLTAIFPHKAYATALTGSKKTAIMISFKDAEQARPFGDDLVEVVRSQYCSDAVV